jgi:hypothetical protein
MHYVCGKLLVQSLDRPSPPVFEHVTESGSRTVIAQTDAPAHATASAKAVVSDLVNEASFNTVDDRPLAEFWRLQPGTPAYCTELSAEALKAACVPANPSDGRLSSQVYCFCSATPPLEHISRRATWGGHARVANGSCSRH